MPSIQEALVFADRMGSIEAWELLERLDERIELRWVVPGKPNDKGCVILDYKFSSPDFHLGSRANKQRGCGCGEDLLTHLMW